MHPPHRRVAHRTVTTPSLDFPAVRAGNVVNQFPSVSFVIQPALDDLYSVKIGVISVSQGPDHESWRLTCGCGVEIAAHRNPVPVAAFSEIRTFDLVLSEIPAGENPHENS